MVNRQRIGPPRRRQRPGAAVRHTILCGPERLEERRLLATWSGDIPNNTVWHKTEVQEITGNVHIPAGATLTIEAGTVVKFDAGRDFSIQVDGRMLAQGTAAEPIYFTSMNDDTVGGDSNLDGSATTPAPFQWESINFANSNPVQASVLDHVEVRYGGENVVAEIIVNGGALTLTNSVLASCATAGIRIQGANPTLANVTFKNNPVAATMDLASNPAISGVTMLNNGLNALRVDGGTLPANNTWDDPDIVYAPFGNITVPAGRTLTIVPGQTIKFRELGDLAIHVSGTLLAQGTAQNPIVFTSLRDDSAGGDTNANGAASLPSAFDWEALAFDAGSSGSVLDHVAIRYGGENVPGAVVANGGQLSLTNSTIFASATAGIRIQNANPTISGVIFQDNAIAASMDLGSNPAINNVTMLANGVNGLQVDGGSLTTDGKWDDPGIPYLVQGTVTVPTGKTLSIAPGQLIKFRERGLFGIVVNGELSAIGTAAAPIIFTSSADDSVGGDTTNDLNQPPFPGHWSGLRVGSGSTANVIRQVEIRYAGEAGDGAVVSTGAPLTLADSKITASAAAGVRVQDAVASISNVSLENNIGPAISVNLGGDCLTSGITASGNGVNAVVIDGGTLSVNRSLVGTGLPYRLGGNVNLNASTTLTIAPGATFEAIEAFGISGAGTLANAGLLRKSIGSTSTFSAAVTNTGTISVLTSVLNLTGGLTNNGNGAITGPAGPTIAIGGNLAGTTQNRAAFAPLETILMNGAGTPAAPQLLEALSADKGATGAGFEQNFGLYSLVLSNNTNVKLFDNADNVSGSGAEAVYAANVVVPAGTTLDLNNLHLYARTMQVAGTVKNGTVTVVPDGGPLARDAVTPGKISASGEIDDWTIFGRSGEALTINLTLDSGSTTPPLFPALNFGQLTLIGPNNQTMNAASNTNAAADVSLSAVTLPQDGTYHIKVQAPAAHNTSTGNYVITAWNATVNTAPMELGKTIAGRIDTPFRSDRWTFAAVAGQAVKFTLLSAEPGVGFDLTGPNGFTAFSGATAGSGDIILPTAGSYSVTAHSIQQRTGAYAFRVNQTAVASLTIGTLRSVEIAGSGQSQLFQFNVPAQQQLLISLADIQAADRNELYVKQGSSPTRSDFQYRFETPASANQQVRVPTASPGTWYVLVYTDLAPNAGAGTLLVKGSTVFLSSITPDHSGTAADTTLTLTGLGFDNATTVSLVSASNVVFPATSVHPDFPTQVTATFAAGSVPAGVYSVQVKSGANDTSTLAGAFTMKPGGTANLVTNLVLPTGFGYHNPGQFFVEYGNTGDIAMPAPMLLISMSQKHANGVVDSKAMLTLNPYIVAQGFWGSGALGFGHTIKILASGATPGVLQPGETMQVPVSYAGWEQPYDLSYPPFQFSIKAVKADEPTMIDWQAFRAAVSPPPLISFHAWNAIWANLQTNTGATWGDYVKTLDRNAAYLGQLGLHVNDISELVGFEISQADGLSLETKLGSTIDVANSAPGLPLTVSHSFANTISERYRTGPFGNGWSFDEGWFSKLYEDSDGTVFILGSGGIQSVFERDSRGGYFALPGDNGVLTALGGGKYSIREVNGNVTVYRSSGLVDYVEDANGNRITATWAFANLLKLTHTSGQTLSFSYDTSGRIISITDSDGLITQYTYSGFQLETVTDPFGQVTRYTYSATGAEATDFSLTSFTVPGNVTRSFSYDAQGRLAETHVAAGLHRVEYAYGGAGAITTRDATNSASTIYLDHRGLVTKIDDPLHRNTYYSYDDNLRITSVIDTAGQRTNFRYDAIGNLSTATDPSGHSVRYVHAAGTSRLTSVIDTNGNAIQFAYDGRGNPISTTYADGSVEQRAYDPVGNVINVTNRRGQVVQYTYDPNGRLLDKTFSDGTHATFVYDALGNMISATDVGGTTNLTYDSQDRLSQITYPGGLYLKYEYDAAGRRAKMTDQTNFTVRYAYDAAGRLISLADGAGSTIVTYTYDDGGQLTRKDNGNHTYSTYAYDAAGQLLHLINYAPDNSVSSRSDYSYDILGRVATISSLDGQWTYTYDATSQLTHAVFISSNPAAVPNEDLQYTYDAAGNRISAVINGVSESYTINNLNQYTAIGSTTFSYDADGNQTSANGPNGQTTYTYNDEKRLISSTSAGDVGTYQYNALGQRIAVTHNGATTRNLIDRNGLGNLVGQFDNAGSPRAHFTYGLGLVSRVDPAGNAGYYDFDSVGNTIAVTGPTGAVLNRYRYQPFGGLHTSAETVTNPFQFGGEYGVTREATGYFTRTRLYDPAPGRFVQTDPFGIQGGTNLYAYSENDPINQSDPSGLAPLKTAKIAITLPYDAFLWLIRDILVKEGVVLSDGAHIVDILKTMTKAEVLQVARGMGIPEAIVKLVPEFAPKVVSRALVAAAASSPSALSRVGGILLRGGGFVLRAVSGVLEGYVIIEGSKFVYDHLSPGREYIRLHTKHTRNFINGYDDIVYNLIGKLLPNSVQDWLAETIGSKDPNDKIGPGFGDAGFVTDDQLFSYRIDFENDKSATAPAQRVTISDKLSSNLDWDTFQLTEIQFGDTLVAIPPGSQHFATTVQMTQGGTLFDVLVEAGLRSVTGEFFATFLSINPTTQLPPDVLIGFLPPEDDKGHGQGHVSYTIEPKAGLATGTAIRNVAVITFDSNPSIATDQKDPHDASLGNDPAKQALVTIDAGAPTSSVKPLTPKENTNFMVKWTGLDDVGGSGVFTYDVFVSDNNGSYSVWQKATTATSALFADATPLHTYRFYAVAADHVGHVEAIPAAAETQTVISDNPWQNAENRLDADHDTFVFPGDVLAVINYINASKSGPLPATRPADKYFVDVDGNNEVAPKDALDIINYINAHPELEGESTATTATLISPSDSQQLSANDQPLPTELLQLIAMDISTQPKRRRI